MTEESPGASRPEPVSPEDGTGSPPRSIVRATLVVILLLFGAALGLWLLYELRRVLFLLLLAVVFAYLVIPLVRILRRPIFARGRSRVLPMPVAIAAVYLAIFGLVGGAAVLLLPVLDRELSQLAREAPGYLTRAEDRWQVWQAAYQIRVLPGEAREAIDRAIHQGAAAGESWVAEDVLPRIGAGLTALPWLLIVPVFAFFLLKDGERLCDQALRGLPRGRFRSRGSAFLGELNETLAAYVRAQVTACLLVGVVCTLAFLLLGIPYAVVLGIAAGVLEFVPLAGPLTIGLLAVGFAAFHSFTLAIGVLCFLVFLRIVQDYVVYPKLVGRGIHMHPMAVILAILCGGEVGGLAGVFLAIPAAAVMAVAWRHYREHQAAGASDESPREGEPLAAADPSVTRSFYPHGTSLTGS